MNRKLILFGLSVVLLFTLGTAVLAQDTGWTCPEGFEGQTLSFYNWATYVAEDTIPNFEAACGVTVLVTNFGSNEEMLDTLRQENKGYDVIVPSDYTVSIMRSEGLLEPLDKENIPNIANLNPDLLNRDFDPGNEYSVPYQWGTVGVGYNVKAVAAVLGEGVEITSWEQVFNYPERRVAWLDDGRILIGTALVYLGFDPNTRNLDELQQAVDFLIEAGQRNVVALAPDNGQELLATGQVDIVIEYNGDIFQVADACAADPEACGTEYVYVIPQEGGNVWIDNMAIPVGAPNKALAEVFINYILDPQVGADISNYTLYASPNQASIDRGLIDPAYLESTAIYPDEEAMAHLFNLTGFGEDFKIEQAYNDAWTDIKIALGQ
jgi:spermidine/putrescine transport system substrate-binding protein